MSEQYRGEELEYPAERVYRIFEKTLGLVRRVRGYFSMPGPNDDYMELESLTDVVKNRSPSIRSGTQHDLSPEQLEYLSRLADPGRNGSPYL